MQTVPFDYAPVSAEVRETLREAFGPNVAIRTEEGEAGQVYVRLVSDCFDDMGEREKQKLIWDTLRRELGPRSQAVALVLAFGMDQI